MTEQLFLTYEDFREKVADKRGKTVAMNDINMMQFSAILYDSLLEQYVIKLRLEKKYHKDYSFRERFAICDNAHLIHWGQWLDIAILTTKHPSLQDAYFFVTGINATFREPCFIDRPFEYRIEILTDERSTRKKEFVFFNRVNEKMLSRVDFAVMNEESEVLEHFYKKQP